MTSLCLHLDFLSCNVQEISAEGSISQNSVRGSDSVLPYDIYYIFEFTFWMVVAIVLVVFNIRKQERCS